MGEASDQASDLGEAEVDELGGSVSARPLHQRERNLDVPQRHTEHSTVNPYVSGSGSVTPATARMATAAAPAVPAAMWAAAASVARCLSASVSSRSWLTRSGLRAAWRGRQNFQAHWDELVQRMRATPA